MPATGYRLYGHMLPGFLSYWTSPLMRSAVAELGIQGHVFMIARHDRHFMFLQGNANVPAFACFQKPQRPSSGQWLPDLWHMNSQEFRSFMGHMFKKRGESYPYATMIFGGAMSGEDPWRMAPSTYNSREAFNRIRAAWTDAVDYARNNP